MAAIEVAKDIVDAGPYCSAPLFFLGALGGSLAPILFVGFNFKGKRLYYASHLAHIFLAERSSSCYRNP